MVGFNMIFKKIGKFILWTLLGIIALPIVLFLFIIFLIICLGKIRYRINAKIGNETTAHVEVSFFKWLVKCTFMYANGKMDVNGRIAWIKINSDNKEPKPEASKTKTTDDTSTAKTPTPFEAKATHKEPLHQNQNITKHKPEREKKHKKEKKDYLGNIKNIMEFMSENEIKKIIYLTIQCFAKFLRVLRPKYINVSGVIGFDDPATTGWAMGTYEAIVGTTGLKPHIHLLGSYHEKALHLDIDTNGQIRLGSLIWPFVWLTLRKPVRRLIYKQIFG